MSGPGGDVRVPLFAWRARAYPTPHVDSILGANFHGWQPSDFACGYCGSLMDFGTDSAFYTWAEWHGCPACGYIEVNLYPDAPRGTNTAWAAWSLIRQFDMNDTAVGLGELTTYLNARRDRIQSLRWRRVEQLVSHLLREHGIPNQLTKQTRDGGCDILVLADDERVIGLVEVKHRRGPIGVSAVRELRGVQFREGIRHAVLVCTSSFTRGAHEEAAASYPRSRGFDLELVDLHDVLNLIQAYARPDRGLNEIKQMALRAGLNGGASTFLPGGTRVRDRNREGSVVGHTRHGINAVAVVGNRADGGRIFISQRRPTYGSRRAYSLSDRDGEVVIGEPSRLTASFDITQWPITRWEDVPRPELFGKTT